MSEKVTIGMLLYTIHVTLCVTQSVTMVDLGNNQWLDLMT
jgi:hypothetical protein